jgi:hypothetical protein
VTPFGVFKPAANRRGVFRRESVGQRIVKACDLVGQKLCRDVLTHIDEGAVGQTSDIHDGSPYVLEVGVPGAQKEVRELLACGSNTFYAGGLSTRKALWEGIYGAARATRAIGAF